MPSVPVTVPSVGESISEGILSRWHKPDGSLVRAGEPLFELETDKATSDIPAGGTGVLRIKVTEGETVAVGATVATIDPADSASTAAPADEQGQPAPAPAPPAPPEAPRDTLPPIHHFHRPSAGSPAKKRSTSRRSPATGPAAASPRATSWLTSSRPPTQAAPASESPTTQPAPPQKPTTEPPSSSSTPRETRERMSLLRTRIAQRLVEVQQTAAILTTFNEVDMSRVIALRTLYKDSFQKKHGVWLGFMSFFVKASIDALKTFPKVNARIDGNEIVYHNFYDIGVAVSTDRGLMVPVIRAADDRSFASIEQAIAQYAAKAREGTIAVDDLQGGTFTITNGGTFGSLLSTPILNPPQSAILGMHAIKKRPVVVDEEIVVRPMMYVALSYDHRLIDGREAVSFLVRIKDCIENPERMMLDL